MKRTFLSMGVVALLAANTYGAGAGWYTATPGGPGASVISQGQGQALVLECDKQLAPNGCSWDVTFNFEAFDGGGVGWAVDLNSPAFGKLSITNQNSTNNPLANFDQLHGAPGSVFGGGLVGPEWLLGDAGGVASAPLPGPAVLVLQTFTLNANGTPTLGAHPIFAMIGGLAWGGNDTVEFSEMVALGSNAAVSGAPTGDLLPDPVIIVNNVPEPATLSLLAFGAIALIRRRA
ncbi:MAG: hypothetical protein HBSAPP02_20950 [Phycisphaerae bacterium]|nr:MAG: hypothetical protein HBSAPP02_20950 [Phycisphaerae bacterium]